VMLDLTTGETRLVTDDAFAEGDPAWSPDGSTLAFWKTNADGNADLYLWDEASDEVVAVTADAAFDADPTWHPDGNRIAFARQPDAGSWSLWELDLDTGEEIQLTQTGNDAAASEADPAVDDQTPAWSPDGTAIAFESRNRAGVAPAETDLFILRDDGIANLTQTSGFELHASW